MCIVLAIASGPAAAVGLGAITQQSALGQPLRVVIPVILAPGEDVPAECFKLASAERDADGIPQLVFARVGVERAPSGTQLVVTQARPIDDPVVRLTVQAGCEVSVRREFTLFMDPPPIEPPLVATESGVRSEAPVVPPRAAAPAPARGAATRAPRASTPTTGAGTRVARKSARSAPAKPRAGAKVAPKRAPRVTAGKPRLTVSSAPPLASGRGGTAVAAPQAQQDVANLIEAETLVLQQRIVELTAMIDRMQQEVRANELAQRAAEEAAKQAAEEAAKQAAQVSLSDKVTRWLEANWTVLATIVGLPLLIAGGLLWKRRRDAARVDDWRAAGRVATGTATRPDRQPVSVLRNPPAGVPLPDAEMAHPPPMHAPVKDVPAKAPAGEGAKALAVSELSQVTEEARVYVALGHPDRAIEVLSEHIRQLPRSMPAAWLMLLELHHRSGRRQEFRRLAEEFHLHFNVQTPLWEGFAASEPEEAGLDTFPHVLKQVVARWGKPECRVFLERLLYGNREGRRIGFPLAAYGDILLLLQIIDAPPIVDIDSDLASDGELGTARPDARAPGGAGRAPRPAAVQPRSRKPMPPEPAPTIRPPQQPLAFELDLDANAGKVGKKPT